MIVPIGSSQVCAQKSAKMTYLPRAVTFFRSGQFQIWKVLQKRVCMLYNICENQLKTPLLTVISAMRGKPVHKGGWAKGGQGGPHKRPWWQVKTVPGGKKNGAKSILGSNRFGKVPGVFFLFSACTLVYIKIKVDLFVICYLLSAQNTSYFVESWIMKM